MESASGLAERLGIQVDLDEIAADFVTGTMPVAGNTQPTGVLHGGSSAAFAEHLASVAAWAHAQQVFAPPSAEPGVLADHGASALGIELSISHHHRVSQGVVRGEAIALHLGRTLATYQVLLRDDQGVRVATARVTCLIRGA